VTVLFADLSGFTRLGMQLDPEELTHLVHECFGELIEEVRACDGWLEKQIGDAILAVFGAPAAHEDDPVRAITAALAMQRRMGSINRRLEGLLPQPLELHIGVNTGLVVMGPGIDDPERGDIIVVGDTVNTGARLQHAAAAGQIVVGEATYAATQHAFDYRPMPPFEAKGKPGRLTAFECLGPRAEPALDRGIGSPLVGRSPELAVLVRRIDELAQGRGGAVAVVGDAGLGKSRLLAEARQATDDAVRWLEGRAVPFSQTISYSPFREIILADAGIQDDDDEATSAAKLERRVGELAGHEKADLLPYLATLLALEVGGDLAERIRYLDAEAMRRQIFRSSRRWLERLAQERPLLVVLEDWHWADGSSLELLQHLLGLVTTTPLLLCCVCRPERDSPAGAFREVAAATCGDRYDEIALAPLSPAQSGELVRNLLGIDDLPSRVRDRIFEKAEGNPFFMEEVVRSFVDLRAIVRDEATGGWRATPELDRVSISDTLRGVIIARVDRLDAEAKEVLRVAAVIGRHFFYRVLRSLADADLELDRQLAFLGQLELIRERSRLPELEYIFKHAVTQEAIYESILLSRRRELHSRVAELLEGLFAERIEEFYGLLAFHYARAERWEKAQQYLLAAGDQAGRLAADAEALAHYREALAAHARAFGEQWDPLQRAVLERKMGEALFRRGEHLEAAEYLQRALAYLGTSAPGSTSRVRLALVRHLLTQAAHRIAPRLFVRTGAAPVDPAAEERAYIFEVLNWIDFFVDQERFVVDALVELNLSEHAGYRTGMVRASFAMGVVCDTIPLLGLAERYLRRAMALAADTGNPTLVAEAHLRLAMHEHFGRGDWDSAVERYRRSAAGFRAAGDLRGWGAATALLGGIVRARGDAQQSLELARDVVRVGREGGDRQVWGWGLGEESRNLRQLGELDAAVEHGQEAIELLQSIPDYLSLVSALGDLGRCFLRQGRLEEAERSLEKAHRLVAERRLRAFLCSPAYIGQAEACLLAAEADPAQLKRARRDCRVALRQARLDREALPAACRCRGTYEWLRGRRVRAERWWLRAVGAAEALGARYEVGAALLELGARTGRREPLVRAETIFAETGAQHDLARTRKHLLGEDVHAVAASVPAPLG
jgi:class 3 adenylate cyclase/tetratricopeptide (TPR) repeat protein